MLASPGFLLSLTETPTCAAAPWGLWRWEKGRTQQGLRMNLHHPCRPVETVSSPGPLPRIKKIDEICDFANMLLIPPGLRASRTAVSYSRRAYILPSLWIFLPWLHHVPKGRQH